MWGRTALFLGLAGVALVFLGAGSLVTGLVICEPFPPVRIH